MMQALSAHQCKPMIRATSGDPADIKRVLDIGPLGMMVPNVASVREARDLVAACRYGPDGFRGAAPALLRATGYGERVADYERWMTEEFLLIIQIESKEAVDAIDTIAAVEGIDMLFIGPIDLSASLGALGQFDSAEFIEALEKIEQSVLAAGKPCFIDIMKGPYAANHASPPRNLTVKPCPWCHSGNSSADWAGRGFITANQ